MAGDRVNGGIMSEACGCRFVHSAEYYCFIGPHVFPMVKFAQVREMLLADGDIGEEAFLTPAEATLDDLRRVHTDAYLDDLLSLRQTMRTMSSELPVTGEIVRAYRLSAGGTIEACRHALACGVAMNLSGGFHHAFPDHAEGFCYINDIAVALRRVRADGAVDRAAVVDLDVHQGNGTAFIFQSEPEVFTFSMHQENNYPVKRQSDLDVGLADGTEGEEYLRLLEEHLPAMLDAHRPQLVVYLAGVDPYVHDQLGGLSLTAEAMGRRDACVIGHCRRRGIALAAVLGGGYAERLEDTVRLHHATGRLLWAAGVEAAGR